jgi:pimeloyl-ACP methyl ester carboxylesterase
MQREPPSQPGNCEKARGSQVITHRQVAARGLGMHIAEAGTGPLVLLLHGFPECWYSWRHQLEALAAAGFHAVAPDQRGYCRTGGPGAVNEYTILHLTGDVIALMDALGEQRAVVVGHDWGAPVAWHTALLRPDRVRGVAGLSVPYQPRGSTAPLTVLRSRFGDGFYMNYFQQPGVADAELARDVPATFRRLLYAGSGEAAPLVPVLPDGGGFLSLCPEPPALPSWLTEADIGVYAAEFTATGFTGPLNWYRNLDRNWALTAAWHHGHVATPALFIGGDKDFVLAGMAGPGLAARLRRTVPGLADAVVLSGCGHWVQQERPAEVNEALINFVRSLG